MMHNKDSQPVARLATLNTKGDDIRKKWYIQYSYRDPISEKMRQFRISKGLNSIHNFKERLQKGQQIVNDLNTRLKNGYNPFEDSDVIYEDQIARRHWTKKNVPKVESKQTFKYFGNMFLKHKKETGLRPGTYTNYKSKLRIFDEWLQGRRMNNKDVSAFTEKQARDFITYLRDDRKISGKTTNYYLEFLSYLYRFIRKHRKRLHNPFEEIEHLKTETKITQYYPERSIKLFKDYFLSHEPQMWLVVQLMYYCYIRPKEIRFLKIKHIRFDEGFILIPADISKVRKDRRPVMPESLKLYLLRRGIEAYHPDDYLITIDHEPGKNPVSKNYLWNHFSKARRALGISKDHLFYGWKHTGMVKANQAGISTKDIQNQAGHHSLDMVDKYLKSTTPVESEALRTKFPEI